MLGRILGVFKRNHSQFANSECQCWCHILDGASWDERPCGTCGHKLNGADMGLTRDRTEVEENRLHNNQEKVYNPGLSCEISKEQRDEWQRGRLQPSPHTMTIAELPQQAHGEPQAQYVPDPVNHPAHYNSGQAKCSCGRRIECIDVTRHHTFNIGNAIKYLWRCDHKGASIEDLRKAVWYIQDEIKERLKNGS